MRYTSFLSILLLQYCPTLVVTTTTTSAIIACGPDADRVVELPGLPESVPNTDWYSGYLVYELAGQQIHTHYTLITAELEDRTNNVTKPLIYWSNGGPGASSLFGLLTELGPYLLNDASLQTNEYRSTGIPTPLYNPHAWSRLGSLLAFDQPAPVGFSYCNSMEEDAEHPHSCGGIKWTDELTAQAAYQALLAFYDKFPCYVTRDLYLTGESYAGIYIPTLAREIVSHKSNVNNIPLRGFAVGDGCLGIHTGICADLWQTPNHFDVWAAIFLAGHGQVPMTTFKNVMNACRPGTEYVKSTNEPQLNQERLRVSMDNNVKVDPVNETACQAAVAKMNEQAGGVYAYGLYDECTYRNGLIANVKGGLNDYSCGGDLVMTDYLKLDSVRNAFHVRSQFYSVDNAEGDFDYTPTETDLTGFYKDMNGKMRILVYNGDTDPAINSFAAQNWTSYLGLQEEVEWRPWTVDGCRKMGGYVTRYEGHFDFLTIRGAGHMVPAIKAAAAFTFMKAWIGGEDYPFYDKDCNAPLHGDGKKYEVRKTFSVKES